MLIDTGICYHGLAPEQAAKLAATLAKQEREWEVFNLARATGDYRNVPAMVVTNHLRRAAWDAVEGKNWNGREWGKPPIGTGPDPQVEASIADSILAHIVALPDGLDMAAARQDILAQAHRLLCEWQVQPGFTGSARHADSVRDLLCHAHRFLYSEPKNRRQRMASGEDYRAILAESQPDPNRYGRALRRAAKEIVALDLFVLDEPCR